MGCMFSACTGGQSDAGNDKHYQDLEDARRPWLQATSSTTSSRIVSLVLPSIHQATVNCGAVSVPNGSDSPALTVRIQIIKEYMSKSLSPELKWLLGMDWVKANTRAFIHSPSKLGEIGVDAPLDGEFAASNDEGGGGGGGGRAEAQWVPVRGTITFGAGRFEVDEFNREHQPRRGTMVTLLPVEDDQREAGIPHVLSTLRGTFHRMHLIEGTKTVEVPTQGKIEYQGNYHWYRYGKHAGSGPFGPATWRFWGPRGVLRWQFKGSWNHETDVGEGIYTRFDDGGNITKEHHGQCTREVGRAVGDPRAPFGLPTLHMREDDAASQRRNRGKSTGHHLGHGAHAHMAGHMANEADKIVRKSSNAEERLGEGDTQPLLQRGNGGGGQKYS